LKIDARFVAGEYEAARTQALAYVEEHPRSSTGWTLLGWSHAKLDELDEALSCFDEALRLDPEADNALVGRGVVYRKLGEHDAAREAYLASIELLPDNAEAYSSLCVIELLEGDDEQAVVYGERAWELRQDLPSIPANLAIAYHHLGDERQRDLNYARAERLGYLSLENLRGIFDGTLSIR
jgi:Flp pilus assembly protein TadD